MQNEASMDERLPNKASESYSVAEEDATHCHEPLIHEQTQLLSCTVIR